MKLVAFSYNGVAGTGRLDADCVRGYLSSDVRFPGHLDDLVQRQDDWRNAVALSDAPAFALDTLGRTMGVRWGTSVVVNRVKIVG